VRGSLPDGPRPPRHAAPAIPFAPPLIGEEEISEVVRALRSGWITTGPRAARLEQEFVRFVSAPAALALNSGTAALHLALLAEGVGPGDAVFVPTMTFASAVLVVEHVGALPVLVDVSPDTLNLEPSDLEVRLNELDERGVRARAVMPVHLYGHPCDLRALINLVAPRGMTIVEDAAHAVPARHRGEMIGAAGRPTAFSFYATKNLTTGEGGMLTGAPDLIERARVLSLHGITRDAWKRHGEGSSWDYEVIAAGFKYNMADIQAAIGIHQLGRLEEGARRRRAIAERYSATLAGSDWLDVPVERPDVESAWHLYVVRLRLDRLRIDRAHFAAELEARGIEVGVHFKPIHLHAYFRSRYGWGPREFPVAQREYERILSLPLYPQLRDHEADQVIESVLDIAEQHAK
jgi:dTDP-4-amino-4,6-dideoxygalactose transaminase